MKSRPRSALLVLTVLAGLTAPRLVPGAFLPAPLSTPAPAAAPLLYIENVGQFEPAVRYMAQAGGQTLWLTEDALWITLVPPGVPQPESREVEEFGRPTGWRPSRWDAATLGRSASGRSPRGVNVRVSFVGANPHPTLEPFAPQPVRVSYFRGRDPAQWRTAVPVWSGVIYRELYPGLDLVLSGTPGAWTPTLLARPGADLEQVRLRVEGAQLVSAQDAVLTLRSAAGEVRLPLLGVTGAARPAASPVVQGEELRAPFARPAPAGPPARQAAPDGSHDLVFATYLGGDNDDVGYTTAVDAAGAMYVTGDTISQHYLATPGAFDPTFNGGFRDAFVAKVSADGSHLLYATYLGGAESDGGVDLAVDAAGAAYVTGMTLSPDFPVTPGALSTQLWGYSDAFVTKLDPSSSALGYSTYLGGGSLECPGDLSVAFYNCGIEVDAQGQAYLVGTSGSSDFPVTPGAYDTSYNGGLDAVVTVLNTTGTAAVYGTYLGGSGDDYGISLGRDAAGNVYVSGLTLSEDFPVTPGAIGPAYLGQGDVFVARLPADLATLTYATYLGGRDYDCIYFTCWLAVDAAGYAYVSGETASSDYPTTAGAYDESYNGNWDAVVTKLAPDGTTLTYSTFLGGNGEDGSAAVTVDAQGRASVGGYTRSGDFPVTPDAYDASQQGYLSGFVTRLSADGALLDYSTYLEGTIGGLGSVYEVVSLRVDAAGAAIVMGHTNATDFPTTPGAYSPTSHGASEAYLAKLAPRMLPQVLLPVLRLGP